MKKQFLCTLLFYTTLLIFIPNLYAVPNLISYQGVLNDANGNPINNTGLEITFSIYDVKTGGTALWSEVQAVQVIEGVFNVKLGAVEPLPAIFHSDTLYLGIKAGADQEMTPRQRITSAPSAVFSVPIGTIMSWAKNLQGVPALTGEWVECNGQTLDDPGSPLNGQVIPNLNGENRYLRGNSESGGVGGGPHNHIWYRQSYVGYLMDYARIMCENGYRDDIAFHTYNSNGAPLIAVYDAHHHANYTSMSETNPYYYNIVWIMKVK